MNYRDVAVSEQDVSEYRKHLEEAPGPRKLGAFYAYNHYANLFNDQSLGIHWAYLNDGSTGVSICTCGLEIASSLAFDTSLGHRGLPSFEGLVISFVTSLSLKKNLHLADALCQACGSILEKSEYDQACVWVANHNKACGGDLVGGR